MYHVLPTDTMKKDRRRGSDFGVRWIDEGVVRTLRSSGCSELRMAREIRWSMVHDR